MKYSAQRILTCPPVEVLKNFRGRFTVEFEDGEIESTGLQLALSRYTWRLLEAFPELTLSKRYHVANYMKSIADFKPGTLANLMAKIIDDIFTIHEVNTNNEEFNTIQDKAYSTLMQVNNELFNDIMEHGAQYRATLNIEDILDIINDPEMIKIDEDNPVNKETIKNPKLINTIYKQKEKLITSNKHLNNNISVMANSGTLKMGQLLQCVGPRGAVTDINSSIFPVPISLGYMHGLHKVHDSLIESRTAAMSLNNQSSPLQFSEYFSRRVQLISMSLKNLHFTDCNSEYYLEIRVRSEEESNDKMISDLKSLEGMNYLDEETGALKQLRATDRHLIGKTLKFRTILGCQHEDPHGVCSACLGAISRAIPRYRNVGHFAVTSLMENISQSILGTKHMTSPADSSKLTLTEHDMKYFTLSKDGLSILFNPSWLRKQKKVQIKVPAELITGLADIEATSNVSRLAPRRMSKINRITLIAESKEGFEEVVLDPVPIKDKGYLTRDVLKIMKKNGWEVDNSGFIIIDLTEIDSTQEIISVPPKQFDMFAYVKEIEKIIKSSVSDIKRRTNDLTPEAFLMELNDTVTMKLPINMSIIQVIAYTMLATDVEKLDYSMPKPHNNHDVGIMDNLVTYRSISAALSYENQKDTLSSPATYFVKNRNDHPMDEFFVADQLKDKLDYYRIPKRNSKSRKKKY